MFFPPTFLGASMDEKHPERELSYEVIKGVEGSIVGFPRLLLGSGPFLHPALFAQVIDVVVPKLGSCIGLAIAGDPRFGVFGRLAGNVLFKTPNVLTKTAGKFWALRALVHLSFPSLSKNCLNCRALYSLPSSARRRSTPRSSQ